MVQTDEFYKILFKALQTRDVDALVKAAYEIMGMPIVVTDDIFVVLGKYPTDELGDEQWDANIIGKQIEPRFINTFQEDNHWTVHEQVHAAVLIDWGYYKDTPRYTSVIRSDDTIIGYFSALATGVTVEQWHYDAMEMIAGAFSVLLGFQEFGGESKRVANDNDYLASTMLHGLLAGTFTTREDYLAFASHMQRTIHGPYVLVSARTRNPYDTPLEVYFGEQFARHYDIVLRTTLDGRLYLLLGGVEADFRNSVRFREIAFGLKEQNVVCGFSRVFEDPYPLGDYRWQADRALMVGSAIRPDKANYHYDDYMLEVVLDVIAKNVSDNNFVHPALKTLMAYDERHRTEYLKTLETYIDSGFDKKQTIESLNIHRNTLLYRLKKITELTNIDIDDKYFALYFSLSAYHLKLKSAERKMLGES